MPKRSIPLLMVSMALLGSVGPLTGQRGQHTDPKGDGTRILSGTVTDQDARPIPHAAVEIENEKTLQVRSYITEAHGEFHFAELSPDADYDVTAVFDNIRSPKKTLSQFDERPRPTMTLVIHLPK